MKKGYIESTIKRRRGFIKPLICLCMSLTFFFMIIESNPIYGEAVSNDDLRETTNIDVKYQDKLQIFGAEDQWNIRLYSDTELALWTGAKAAPFGETAYSAWFSDNDWMTISQALKDGGKEGLDLILGSNFYNGVKSVEKITKAKEILKNLNSIISTSQGMYSIWESDEPTSLTSLKILMYGFLSENGALNPIEWKFLTLPYKPNFSSLFSKGVQIENIQRIDDKLVVVNGAKLQSFQGITTPKISTDNGSKQGKETEQTLRDLIHGIYLYLEHRDVPQYSSYIEKLVASYVTDFDQYQKQLDTLKNNIEKEKNALNDAITKATYKVSKGKLIDAKTKKVVKGYKVYNKKLYYNGSLKKGYKVYNKKLYYNGSLKKEYKVYNKKLYYNGSLKKGYKSYSTKLYKNGSLFTGTYKNDQYKLGEKLIVPPNGNIKPYIESYILTNPTDEDIKLNVMSGVDYNFYEKGSKNKLFAYSYNYESLFSYDIFLSQYMNVSPDDEVILSVYPNSNFDKQSILDAGFTLNSSLERAIDQYTMDKETFMKIENRSKVSDRIEILGNGNEKIQVIDKAGKSIKDPYIEHLSGSIYVSLEPGYSITISKSANDLPIKIIVQDPRNAKILELK